jgi:uncharacterized repeat protein (TIGR01451 family)
VCQRKRFGVVLLLVAGLVSLLSRPVPAQDTPSSWAAPGAARADAGGQPQVIASTKTTPPPAITGDRLLPPPDDGLSALKAKDAVKETPLPPPLPTIGEIQQMGYLPPKPKAVETKQSPASPMISQPLESMASQEKWGNAAQLAFLVMGPENAVPGQAVACQIQVKNRGAQMLAEVGVNLPIPPGARIIPTDLDAERQNESLVWKLGNLEPLQERVLRFEVQSIEPGEVYLRPRATFGPGAGLRTSMVRPPFSLSVTGPEGASVGEKVVFNVQVGNHTSSPITNVNLRCELSEGLVHPEGREVTADLAEPLLPSQVRSISLETLVRAPGRHQITVHATAIGGHRGQASWSVPVSEASLVLVQYGPRQANLGETLTYRLEVRNPGRSAVGPVRLSQALPEGVGFGSASTAGMFEVATQSIVWTLPALQPGEMQAVTFTAQGRKPGDWAMPVSAGATGVTEARATHAVRIDSAPMSSLTLKTQDARLAINGETVCEVRLYNQGPNNMRDARLVVQIPEGLDVVTVEGPTRWQQRGKQVVFEPMIELRPRVDAIYRVRVRAVSGTDATIQAELNAAGMEKPQQAFRAIRIVGADEAR